MSVIKYQWQLVRLRDLGMNSVSLSFIENFSETLFIYTLLFIKLSA